MTWTEPAIWYAELPAFHAAAAAYITDPVGDVLLVKPTYRDHWAFPGGYVEAEEYPHQACARELHEELGIPITPGNLLVVDWSPPTGPRPRALVHFTFDGGILAGLGEIRLSAQELDDAAFVPPERAARLLPANVAPRVPAAARARTAHAPAYLAGGLGYPPSTPLEC
ncbi:NUDIX domain-containing protein [Micromonospora craniellae]|uniref:NUDIX hydrolase n=1 Tax=Micromonospora craniellae TaxID=2294034 RepID=A0A372G364_9ACTN|nr:NUDIX hydrolase [Micromonospora craniellae]QOC91072.1 NUDIX hydrolase [Micromonospora craniellae]RFS47196.1 NUDIX hydrolase [Micromonospora craniellae]